MPSFARSKPTKPAPLSPKSSSSTTARSRAIGATSSSSRADGELRQASARIRQRPPSQRTRERVGSGRAPLYVPQQRGGVGDLNGAESDKVPENARAE